MERILLKGITWDHSRGYTPLVAASQRFHELHPHIEIAWTKRSLQAFADFPIEQLAETFDLLVIDHPWVGYASALSTVHPLDLLINGEVLEGLAENSVGASFFSYQYDGHLWALPIDAATPVASYRCDLMEEYGSGLPTTWEDVLNLAQKGKVAAPGIEVDVLMNFYMFCIAHGETPFTSEEGIVTDETGILTLETMREFYSLLHPDFFTCNPIAVAEKMSSTDDFFYCPFAYGYSNYSRDGYGKKLLKYTDLVNFRGKLLNSTLGGTGLSVSVFSRQPTIAADFAAWVAGESHQRTMYTMHGGQPGHRAAWLCSSNNALTHQYFFNTLSALDRAFVRPRYAGYLHFQDHAGLPLQQYLQHGGRPAAVLKQMNDLYRKSRRFQNTFFKSYA
jgi:multiple sugar transport system substrate-binding protein